MAAEGVPIVETMQDRAPVDTGDMRDGLHAEAPWRKGRTLVLLFASSADTPYAIYVHEDPDARHRVGEWKFMENPLKEAAPTFMDGVGARVQLDKVGQA